MSDDRDIDEILASLDALLRENDASDKSSLPSSKRYSSHNDDMPDESIEARADDVDIERLDLQALDELEKSMNADSEAIQSVEYLEDSVVDVGGDSAVDADNAMQTPESNDSANVGTTYLHRVVLTEEMLVDNQQVSLPLAFNHQAEDRRSSDDAPIESSVEKEVEQAAEQSIEVQDESVVASDNQVLDEAMLEPVDGVMQAEKSAIEEDASMATQADNVPLEHDETHVETDTHSDLNRDSNEYEEVHAMHVDKKDIEQLLELVSMDVSYQIHRILPNMIRESLHEHLADMQRESAALGKTNKFNSNQDENS